MPLVRYELGSEFRMANPELYQSVSKEDAGALFESITMAALAGIVRQLGEVAELGAEIFGDLHEQVLGVCSRGRRLAARVEQLEAKLPAVEKSVGSETDQLRFAFTRGIDWQPTISEKQNHFSQEELPQFIQKKYDECREPPRFYLVDSFDVAGPGASLRRYTDPSFFRTEWASCELLKAEKAPAGRRTGGNRKERKLEPCNSDALLSKDGVSLLKASKYIHSVDTFSDPYLENWESSESSPAMETLRISAKEIEAGSLLRKKVRYPSASDSDPAMFADSPEQFVDALTSMDPEAAPDSDEMKLKESDASRPTSSGSNHVDSPNDIARESSNTDKTVPGANGYKQTNGPEPRQEKAGMVNRYQETTELSFYSSSSPSELSSPLSAEHSPCSSGLSDEAYSQPAFSLLDSPISHVEMDPVSRCMLFSPGSPTLNTREFEERTPAPPPLPPSKWMMTTNHISESHGVPVPEKRQKEDVVVASELHESLMGSIVSHDKENQLRKVNGHTRAKSFDSREVLLEQIRSRSFNLKHAEVQERAEVVPAPTASVNVAAILEKASAMRQALQDSDCEDDFN